MPTSTCPACHGEVAARASFCRSCGKALGTADARPRSWLVGHAADCDIVLGDGTVSRHHCRLTRDGDAFLLEDLGSTNGTFVNGERLTAPRRISRLDAVTLGSSAALPWPDEIGATVIRIGRAKDNDVVLSFPTVSAHHARIVTDGGATVIEDLGSTNGTAIGSPENRIVHSPLRADDAVFLGSLRVPAVRLLSGDLALGGEANAVVTLAGESLVLGRDPACDHVLDHPAVSRRHARISRRGDLVVVEDLGSANGTFVNGKRVTGPVVVKAGDVVALGSFTFELTVAGTLAKRDYRGDITIEACDLAVTVPGKTLLEGASLTVYPSELVAVMGPSGAGKTTLMNALNGYTAPSAGTVLFNGTDLYANWDRFCLHIGYVPQDDIMHRDLTVGEALYFTARLRLPADFSDEEIRRRIAVVLAELGLEGTEDVLIGSPEKKGISGGQRKRVNIAMELLTDPAVLFLDEPTSGLSSVDALTVIRLLRKLADAGKTVILTIHQPSLDVFRLMDTLALVSKERSGAEPAKLVYFGRAYPDAVDFFNPGGVPDAKTGSQPHPDEVLRGLARRTTQQWATAFASSPTWQEYVGQRAGTQAPRSGTPSRPQAATRRFGFAQWWTLLRRTVAVKARDVVNTAVLGIQAPLIALLMVAVFREQVVAEPTAESWPAIAKFLGSNLFVLCIAAIWFGCNNSAREIVAEWAIYHRERMVNLKIPSYVFSKLAVLGLLCVAQCIVMLLIVGFGVELKGPWLEMFGVVLLVSLVGLTLGLAISASSRTSEVAVSLVPVVLIPMMIVGGAMLPVHKMIAPVKVVSNVIAVRWGFEALVVMEAEHRPQWRPPQLPPVLPAPPTAALPNPAPTPMPAADAIDTAEHYFPLEQRSGLAACVGVLAGSGLALLALALAVLRRRDVH